MHLLSHTQNLCASTVTGNYPDILHGNSILPRDERAHALVGAILRRRFAHEYFQPSFFCFLEIFFARIRPYLHADELLVSHTIKCACTVPRAVSAQGCALLSLFPHPLCPPRPRNACAPALRYFAGLGGNIEKSPVVEAPVPVQCLGYIRVVHNERER